MQRSRDSKANSSRDVPVPKDPSDTDVNKRKSKRQTIKKKSSYESAKSGTTTSCVKAGTTNARREEHTKPGTTRRDQCVKPAPTKRDQCVKPSLTRRDSMPQLQIRRDSSAIISEMPTFNREPRKVFTLTEAAKMVQSTNNIERGSSYKPRMTALAQLIDLEEDMARDGFDYSIFEPQEDPVSFREYKNGLNDDIGTLEGFLKLKTEPVALWNERQAREKQQRCPRTEESGLMGLWNVMMSLGVSPKLSMEDAVNLAFHRRKEETSPLPQYLFSCSRHGMTHEDLLRAMEVLSNGRVAGRFFEFYPQRRVDIRYWLAGWIKRGVVPLATLNYQKTVRCQTEEEKQHQPQDWHHHMVYGVSYDGIHLTNPLCKMKADHFKIRLESESVVMIHRDEILGRVQKGMNCDQLKQSIEWTQMDVLGQIEVIEREEERFHKLSINPGMKFIAIPSSMIGGITLFAHRDSENYRSILNSEEIFLKV